MTGQIPPYGRWFQHVRTRYVHPSLSSTVYPLRRDPDWFIRSNRSSHKWWVFHREQGQDYDGGLIVSPPMRTMKQAMDLLVSGFQQRYYNVR